jgi:hypothetical protein
VIEQSDANENQLIESRQGESRQKITGLIVEMYMNYFSAKNILLFFFFSFSF